MRTLTVAYAYCGSPINAKPAQNTGCSGTLTNTCRGLDASGGNLLDATLEQLASYSATVAPTAPVPEPGTLLVLGSGAGVLLRRRRARQA